MGYRPRHERDADQGRDGSALRRAVSFPASRGSAFGARIQGSGGDRASRTQGRGHHAAERGVTLTFTNGVKVTADAVIGADGVHSTIREAMLGPEKPRFTGRVAYRTVFPAALLGDKQITPARTKWW